MSRYLEDLRALAESEFYYPRPVPSGELVGGLDRVVKVYERELDRLRQQVADRDELLSDIWLYTDWRSVTRRLGSEERELWAAVVEEQSNLAHPDEPMSAEGLDRWWR